MDMERPKKEKAPRNARPVSSCSFCRVYRSPFRSLFVLAFIRLSLSFILAHPSLSLSRSLAPPLLVPSLLGNHASVRNLSFSFSRTSTHPHKRRQLPATNTFAVSLSLSFPLSPSSSLLFSLSASLFLFLPIYPTYFSFRIKRSKD